MPVLVVNVDHVATLRQARMGTQPDPVTAAHLAELAGAHGIIVHLREDRRHIQDRDLDVLAQTVQTNLHLEMAATKEMHAIALRAKPHMVCLVPEKRRELTTEGGMNLVGSERKLRDYLADLHAAGIHSSLFIDADPAQIEAAKEIGAEYVEIHTGHFAGAKDSQEQAATLRKILRGVELAHEAGLKANLGHGLNYVNVLHFAHTPGICEYSIGHSIMARAIFVGISQAVRDMADIIRTFPR